MATEIESNFLRGRFQSGKSWYTPRQFSQEWQAKDLEDTDLGREYGTWKSAWRRKKKDENRGGIGASRQNDGIAGGGGDGSEDSQDKVA